MVRKDGLKRDDPTLESDEKEEIADLRLLECDEEKKKGERIKISKTKEPHKFIHNL